MCSSCCLFWPLSVFILMGQSKIYCKNGNQAERACGQRHLGVIKPKWAQRRGTSFMFSACWAAAVPSNYIRFVGPKNPAVSLPRPEMMERLSSNAAQAKHTVLFFRLVLLWSNCSPLSTHNLHTLLDFMADGHSTYVSFTVRLPPCCWFRFTAQREQIE